MNRKIEIGSFVTVGDSIVVVVGFPDNYNVPEEHLAIWYGQIDEDNTQPLVRTVPEEYCIPFNDIQYYH